VHAQQKNEWLSRSGSSITFNAAAAAVPKAKLQCFPLGGRIGATAGISCDMRQPCDRCDS
jgi:hypothetical protein